MSQYFPKPYKLFGANVNVKVDLPNYKTKADLNATGIDTSDCMFLSFHVHVSELIHTLWLPECQGTPCPKLARNLKFK